MRAYWRQHREKNNPTALDTARSFRDGPAQNRPNSGRTCFENPMICDALLEPRRRNPPEQRDSGQTLN